ncbi:MAG TPA: hypothetical protein VII57_08350 [Dehalococcoidia bacterium]
MEEKLCPRCGAYWRCDCRLEELAPVALTEGGCEHDWSEAVGVEVDGDLGLYDARVVVCRLCGLYAVEERVGR